MKVAIVKPDHHLRGGFEIVVERILGGLRERGHEAELVQIDAAASPVSHLPVDVEEDQLERFREFFFHLNTLYRFEALDVSDYDAVLCAQPGSYAIRHPAKVALFYHHVRTFYDLFGALEGIESADVALHHLAAFIVRDVDSLYLTPELPILAGSRRVQQRLADHNGLEDNVEVFSAGIDETFLAFDRPVTFEQPLCVGRHEFPKRTELFLHAMSHVAGLRGRVIGAGEFSERLEGIEAWLRLRHVEQDGERTATACPIDDDRLWRERMIHLPPGELLAARQALDARGVGSAVDFLGRASHDDLLREYGSALCVVCPAFDEDYGLTCLEAMACGKPVIACHDGGGIAELIEDGVDGLLVEPTGPAIGAAIERLRVDTDRAREMGDRGREKARAFTWARAIDQVEQALARASAAAGSRDASA